jgi:multisubunit Na+/H+ antiporter MnhB subunit
MEHVSNQHPQATAVRVTARSGVLSGRASEPSRGRFAAVLAGTLLVAALFFGAARWLAPSLGEPGGFVVSLVAGVTFTLLIGSVSEWIIHRWIMHRPSRLPIFRLAYEHHHRAHHWINFPPDNYIQEGPVRYVPLWTERLDRVATSHLTWAVTVASHLAFYSVFALALVLLPAWLWSGNGAFAGSVTVTTAVVLFLAIHAHDAMHYPGLSPIERFRFFKWLDHHHYIHHIDTGANTNFLMPLGDLLLGTLRRELTEDELRRWPTYAEARRRLIRPAFAPDGTRLPGSVLLI